jgi:hypothetical protein
VNESALALAQGARYCNAITFPMGATVRAQRENTLKNGNYTKRYYFV